MPVLLTSDFPPARGGIQRYVGALADALHAEGYPVAVVAPGSSIEPEDTLRPYPVLRYSGGGRLGEVVRMLECLKRAHPLTGDGVTIASSWLPAGLVGALYHGARPEHLAILVHGTEIAPHAPPWRLALQRAVFRRAAHRIVNSRFTARQLARSGITEAVSVVCCGVDAWPVVRHPATAPTILSVGRLIARKGFDRVIAALPALAESVPGVRYEIIGNGPQRRELEALAARLGVAERVRFLGEVDDQTLHEAYGRAWCFALPARAEGDDVEGFGIVYLEAALAALPSLGGRATGAEDAIVDGTTGVLVDGRDVGAVRAALARMLTDRTWALSLGLTGRRRALSCFTWQQTAKRIAAIVGLERKDLRLPCSA